MRERRVAVAAVAIALLAAAGPAAPALEFRAGHRIHDLALAGERILVATQEGGVEVFDPLTGRALTPLVESAATPDRPFPPPARSVAVSPSGRRVAVAFSDGRLLVLRRREGAAPETVLTWHSAAVQVCRFVDEATLVAGTIRGELLRLSVPEGVLGFERHLEYDSVTALAIHPDRRRVAVAFGSSRIQLVDLETGATVRELTGHRDAVYGLAWRGKDTLVSAGKDKRLLVWDVSRPERPPSVLHEQDDYLLAVAVAPDGRWLATTLESKGVGILRLPSGRVERVLHGHEAPVQALAFADRGRRLVSAGSDARILVWDLAEREGATP